MAPKKRGWTNMTNVDISRDYKWGTELEDVAIKSFEKNVKDGDWLPFMKMGKFSHFDFCSLNAKRRGKMAFVEVKSRRCKRSTYEDTIIPSIKMQKALAIINDKHEAYLLLNFEDEICFVDLKVAKMHFGYNARTDRGRVELGHYAFISLEQFKTIEKKEDTNDSKKSKTT